MSPTPINWLKTFKVASFGICSTVLLSACGSSQSQQNQPIKIDGSSTVYPITEKIVEQFNAENTKNVDVTANFSGTGGGFQKFCAGETDINNASRPISRSEMETCKQNNIAYIELPVAFDGLTVVVNPQNTWASEITVEELKKIWEPGAQQKITKWNQVRSSWPDRPLVLFGPGTDSGTYDYFTEAIVGKAGASRSDYTASEDDEILAQGVSGNPNTLGYFGYAYYDKNQDKLKPLAVDNGSGAVMPSEENLRQNQYRPLARPLFIYVNAAAARDNPLMTDFIDYYLRNAEGAVSSVGYIPFEEDDYSLLFRNFHKTKVGTAFGGESEFTMTIDEVLTKFTEW
ncbi:PstS family phosphate ABC transporter substrate-binding protein [Capilliphycus salinus ALCB114379]|uniref:PstS family phosphate ABC transporter substrate-binding protein n=1 Tax=Capilliphycus salinus TaxID=2768948 RepID=UPI0039A518ED